METEQYQEELWNYIVERHPDIKIANKSYGSYWKYATPKEYNKDYRVEPSFYNHRQVLPEELVADIDCPSEELRENALQIINALKEKGYEYSVWRTNGTDKGGIHIHSFFDIPENISDIKLLKRLLMEHLVGDLKELGLDSQVLGNHLIRFEGGLYDKVPNWKANKKTLLFSTPLPLQKNKIPEIVWVKYTENVLKHKLRKFRQARKITKAGETPPSIAFIMSPEFKNYMDGGKRAIFVVASYYRYLSDEDLFSLLSDFNKYNLKVPFTDRQLRNQIKSIRKNEDRFVGERYRKDLLRDIGAYDEVYKDD